MQFTRRGTIQSGLAMTLWPGDAFAQTSTPLKTLAAAKGIRFGTAIGARSFADVDYRALTIEQCSVVTPENAMKWPTLGPAADRFALDEADRFVAWAEKAGLDPRCHVLLWGRQDRLPGWVANHDFGSKPVAEADRIVGRHVATIARRYSRRVRSIDVVNEAIDPGTGAMRESALAKAAGGFGHLIALSFQLAREAAPSAELVYNDFMDWGSWSAKHRAGVLRLLEAMRKGDIPCDALGIQAHVNASANPASATRYERDWRLFLDEVTGMGYRLLVTEFDVDDRELPTAFAERDPLIAAYARSWCDIVLSYPQCSTFVTWGLSDKYSWLHGFLPRPDKQNKRGCLYDDALRAKPLREALAASFIAAPVRPVAPQAKRVAA
jgi:endo-1,4-beta-xylanase